MPTPDIRQQVAVALDAVQNKKAEDVSLLQLPSESSAFTDYFLICSGSNPRQVQAIADEVDERLSKGMGVEPNAREGYDVAERISQVPTRGPNMPVTPVTITKLTITDKAPAPAKAKAPAAPAKKEKP